MAEKQRQKDVYRVSIFGDAWRRVKKLKARDFIKAATTVVAWIKGGKK